AATRHHRVAVGEDVAEQRLLEFRRARRRDSREKAGVETERDRDGAHDDQGTERAAYPFLRAERALQGGEHFGAEQQRRGERHGTAGGEREQQQRRLEIRAVQRGARQDQPENGPRAGRPQQAGRDAEQQRSAEASFVLQGRARQSVAERDE